MISTFIIVFIMFDTYRVQNNVFLLQPQTFNSLRYSNLAFEADQITSNYIMKASLTHSLTIYPSAKFARHRIFSRLYNKTGLARSKIADTYA